MRVRINTDEMENITKKIDAETISLYKEINACLKDIDKISKVYQSIESDYVLAKSSAYLEHLKTVPFAYYEINNVIKKANNVYIENDSEFAREFQKERCEDNDREEDTYQYN